MTLVADDVKKIARLARIKLEPGENDMVVQQLNGIMAWIDQLQQVDVSAVTLHTTVSSSQMHERDDVVTDPDRVADIIANAPQSQHMMFAVPKVVD